MRKIKFRGKTMSDKFYPDLSPSKWVYGFITQFPKDFDWMHIGPNDNRVMVHSDTVGQFTGLKDKDGVEIYEGDVIERFKANPHYRNGEYYDGNAIYGVVRYIESGFYIVTNDNEGFKLCSDCDLWVKGNIFDNPDLLNSKSE